MTELDRARRSVSRGKLAAPINSRCQLTNDLEIYLFRELLPLIGEPFTDIQGW